MKGDLLTQYMHPITYPSKTLSVKYLASNVAGSTHSWRKLSSQPAPYNLAGPYLGYLGKLTRLTGAPDLATTCDVGGSGPNGYQAYTPNCRVPGIDEERDDLNNRLLQSFQDALGDSAELAVTLAEYKQSVSMIQKRALQAFQFARAIRRFDAQALYKAVAAETTYTSTRALSWARRWRPPSQADRRRDLAGSLANTWLEWHFGWKPMIQDIANATRVITNADANAKHLRDLRIRVRSGHSQGGFDFTTGYSGAYYHITARHEGSVKGALSAKVNVSNPDVYLQNRLGLLNPAGIVWELIPFSFVVDWFANVDQILAANFNPFAGLTLSDPCLVHVVKDQCTRRYMQRSSEFGPFDIFVSECETVSKTIERSLTIPTVSLSVKPMTLSLSRAQTAVSLLLQVGLKPLEKDLRNYASAKPQPKHKAYWPSNYDVKHR